MGLRFIWMLGLCFTFVEVLAFDCEMVGVDYILLFGLLGLFPLGCSVVKRCGLGWLICLVFWVVLDMFAWWADYSSCFIWFAWVFAILWFEVEGLCVIWVVVGLVLLLLFILVCCFVACLQGWLALDCLFCLTACCFFGIAFWWVMLCWTWFC